MKGRLVYHQEKLKLRSYRSWASSCPCCVLNKDQQHNKFPLERVIWDFYSDISDKKIFIHTFSHPDAFRKVFEALNNASPIDTLCLLNTLYISA